MSEKINVEIGVFDTSRSEEESYNQPIGLALCGDTEGIARVTIALANHGHHNDLYLQLLEKISDNKKMPRLYFNGVDAYGFLKSTDKLPTVNYIDKGDSSRKIAAQALYTAFMAKSHLYIPVDNSLRPLRIRRSQLEEAVFQTLTQSVV